MVLSYTKEVDHSFKKRIVWWYAKLNNVELKIWQDPWLDFMLCWMMFDAYLTEISKLDQDCKKLDYFYQENNDFKDRFVSKGLNGNTLKELSPVHDMRPNSNLKIYLNDINDLQQIFGFMYQIRCNLFHGAKDLKNERDAELVRRAAKLLRSALDAWMKGD